MTSFTRLSLLAFASVLLLTLGGWMISGADIAACAAWPLCFPLGSAGMAQLLHRVSAGLTSVLMLALLFQAWSLHRDHRWLLPAVTVSVSLFFSQMFIGAVQVTHPLASLYRLLHTFTAVSALSALALTASLSLRLSGQGLSFPPLDLAQRLKDFLILTKPIIVLLLLVTTFAGMVAGGKAWPSLSLTFFTLLGGALAAGGSGAINQYIDRDLDKNMQRTARRPLAAGRMTPAEGLSFGLALSIFSFYLMAAYVNFLAALLSLAGIFYYVVLYSLLLKKATVQNIVIGGGAGAIPPMVGWAAATGGLDIPALILFLIVFMWTPPHFWALAIVRRKDYERAGVPMLPVIRGEAEARKQVFLYTLELVGVTFLLPLFKYTGAVYFFSALGLGLLLLYFAWHVLRTEGNKVAWLMYRYSSMYLMFLFVALMVDSLLA